ncbi:MAG: Uma2 family endonuclease [bacterium]
MSEAAYLALEAEAETRHEYVNGEMVAMSGGTPAHAAIAANLARALGNRLIDRPCLVLSSDARVNVDATGPYPDLTIVCDPPRFAPKSPITLGNPTVLIEVLSDSTEAYDRGAKFAHYRHLDSLQSYLLVAQAPRRVEHFQRMPGGRWLLTVVEDGDVEIPCLGFALPLDEIYLKLDLLAPPG